MRFCRALLFALLAACGEDLALSESRASFRIAGPSAYDFGALYIGQEHTTSLTVRNDGLAPLHYCARFDPIGPGFSAVVTCREVAGGAEAEVEISFAPGVLGKASATLLFTHDAPEPAGSVRLTGEGLAVPACDDSNVCTDDAFDLSRARCVFTPRADGSACNDGKACTVQDVCATGRCVGGGRDCDDGDRCTRDLCEEPTGCVHLPGALLCGDSNPCTADGCDPEGGCYHQNVADGVPCDDGVTCTYGELCISGACKGVNVPDGTPCADQDPCTTDDQCILGRCISEAGAHLVPGDVRWTYDTSHGTDPVSPRGLRSPGTLDAAGNIYIDDDPGTLVSLNSCGGVRWVRSVATRNLHLNYRRMSTNQLLVSVESESTDAPQFDVVRARLLDTGAPLWTAPLGQPRCPENRSGCDEPRAVRVNDAALTAWGAVIVAGHQQFENTEPPVGYELEHFIMQIDATGTPRWRTVADAPNDEWMFGYPLLVGADGRAFAGTWAGYYPDYPSKLYAFSPLGARSWTIDWPQLNDYLTGAPGVLFEASSVRARDFSGQLLWERPDLASPRYRLNYGAVVRPDGAYVFLRTSWEDTDPYNELIALTADGELLWRHPLEAQPTASLAMAEDGTLYTAIDSTVIAVNADGNRRWTAVLPTDGEKLRNILTLGAPGHLYVATPKRLFALWIGPGKLAAGWSRFRGGNNNGCSIAPGTGGP